MAHRTAANTPPTARRFHTINGAVIEAEPVGDGRQSLQFRATLHFTSPPLAGLALRGFCVWQTGAGLLVTPPRLHGNFAFLTASHLAASDLVEQADSALKIAVLEVCSARPIVTAIDSESGSNRRVIASDNESFQDLTHDDC